MINQTLIKSGKSHRTCVWITCRISVHLEFTHNVNACFRRYKYYDYNNRVNIHYTCYHIIVCLILLFCRMTVLMNDTWFSLKFYVNRFLFVCLFFCCVTIHLFTRTVLGRVIGRKTKPLIRIIFIRHIEFGGFKVFSSN